MNDNLIASISSGNRSLKVKLEAVRLQIVALLAVESQLEQWISQEEASTKPKISVQLTNEQIEKITTEMKSGSYLRVSAQSVDWAGYAVVKAIATPNEVANDWREYALKALDFMEGVGALKRASKYNADRGRDVPMYEICSFPL